MAVNEFDLVSFSKAVIQQTLDQMLCGAGDNVNARAFNLFNPPTLSLAAYYCSFRQHKYVFVRVKHSGFLTDQLYPLLVITQYNTKQVVCKREAYKTFRLRL